MNRITTTDLSELPFRSYAINCPRGPDKTALLAGGLKPRRESQSNCFAYTALYDLEADRPMWEFKESKNYPFKKVVATGNVCAVLMSRNFTRAVRGVFLFDLSTGDSERQSF